MTIITNRRFLSAIPLAISCAGAIFTSTVFARTPVVTTALDEAPPPWGGNIQQENVIQNTASAGVPEWYQRRMNQQPVSGQRIQGLEAQARAGDADAMYQLGLLYQSGQGVAANQGRARQLLEQAARAGEARAQYALALLFRQHNNPALIQQSVSWQQKAARQGHVEAQYGLGMLYANGQHVPRDLHKARHWLQQASQRNHSMAAFALQDLARATPQPAPRQVQPPPRPQQAPPQVRPPQPPPQQLAAITPAPVTKPPVAKPAPRPAPKPRPPVPQTMVEQQQSRVNLNGKSTAEIRQAAEKGDKFAQLMYGALFEDGAGGMKQNPAEAVRWYLKAARQGYPKAQHNLALMYEDGKGIPQDYEQAAIWYKKAAAAGFSEAQNNLAVLYILGNGVTADRGQAERLLRQSAAQGNVNAKRNLNMLLNGEG